MSACQHPLHAGPSAGAAAGSREVVVTEVTSAGDFYIQFTNEPRVAWIEEQLAGLSLANAFCPELPAGSTCLAQFTLDDKWYR